MKKSLTLFTLLALSSLSFGAEDGTGQDKNAINNQYYEYCQFVIKAEDGTGQNKAEDGTGQNKAEDGTGQGKSIHPALELCNRIYK
ncbi:MAG: hypothetical protein R3E90_15150 [Marinicella sp.]|nr:hypothetical protein [Xanthomonadales bacterium]